MKRSIGGVEPSLLLTKVDLSDISGWRIGGAAELIAPSSLSELSIVMKTLDDAKIPHLTVGAMTNLLFDSEGYRGVLIQIGEALSRVRISGTTVRAGAGVQVPELARRVADRGLTGLEHVVGIPGTLGGLVAMNGGSRRESIGTVVREVVCVDRRGRIIHLLRDDCAFGYRSSRMQTDSLTIVEVELELEPGQSGEIHREMDEIVQSRASKFPLGKPSCGSTFLSDPRMYATVGPPGAAIEAAGLKGLRNGNAQISAQHANFIVNNGGATSSEVLWLIAAARSEVHRRTGYLMDCEVRYVPPVGGPVPAHIRSDEMWTERAAEELL